ncbi:hypothetical protein MASR2M78_07560 [Treponema sp.]
MKKLIILSLFTGIALLAGAQDSNSIRKSIVETALQYKGVPYVYGSESPRAFDCSGFVRYVYGEAAGIPLPRSSKALWADGIPSSIAAAKPGDILVFDTVGGAPSHVAILMNDKSLIHAVSEGPSTGVIVSSIRDKYFAPRLMGARVFIASTPSKPRTPLKPAPKPDPKKPAEDTIISTIGLTITNTLVASTDKIPAALGSALQYAVTNGTGEDGVFEILFYKMDLDPSKAKTLRRDRVSIAAGKMKEIEPYVFTEAGQYKLILKTHDNLKRVERIWKVMDIK